MSIIRNPKNVFKDNFGVSCTEDVVKLLESELKAICYCVAADNNISLNESQSLLHWLQDHANLLNKKEAHSLICVLKRAVEDDVISDDENQALLDLILPFARDSFSSNIDHVADIIPFDPLPDEITPEDFIGKSLCITGAMAHGVRGDVIAHLEELGVVINENITKQTNFLVVGAMGYKLWPEGGTKDFDKVVKYRGDYPDTFCCNIITENDLLRVFPKICNLKQANPVENDKKKTQNKTDDSYRNSLLAL